MNPTTHDPILPLHRMAIFMPGRQGDAELKAGYIARLTLLDMILEDIASTRPGGIPQHHLIIGQRGMGKSTLLRRLDVALREAPLAQRFIPLSFPEEQWSVDRLSTVWLNCLDSLADTLEKDPTNSALIQEIDQTVERLRQDTAHDEILAQDAQQAFLKISAQTGRCPVLLVDNLDLVFERLKKHELHALRAFVMRAGAPILIGTAVYPPAQTQNYQAPFYDHFKTHYLSRLSLAEMREVLLRLAKHYGNQNIPARLDLERGRLHALHTLTGGNPRTTVILFQIFARGFSQDAYQDLEALLDWMTPLYKARFEELSDQAQVVVGAIATLWEPATSARICERTRLQNNQISPHLDRLHKAGLIEEVTVDPEDRVGALPTGHSPQDRTGYQLAERFFNIWFLMRQATRRDKKNLTFLTRFIECMHTPAERDALARELLTRHGLSREQRIYGLALEAAVATAGLRYELHDHIEDEFIEAKRRLQERIDEIIDATEIPQQKWALAELRDRLVQAVPAEAGITGEDFANAVLGSPAMMTRREAIAASPLDAQKIRELMQTAAEETQTHAGPHGTKAVAWFQRLLRSGVMADEADPIQVAEAFKRADTRAKVALCQQFTSPSARSQLTGEAWQHVEKLLLPHAVNSKAAEWVEWGNTLTEGFSRHAEAEVAYRRAIELDPNCAVAWEGTGALFLKHLARYAEAETALRKAIELDPTVAARWFRLGHLLHAYLERFAEAEAAYRKALELNPQDAVAWNNLGALLADKLGRYAEAEDAYRQAITIDSRGAAPGRNLGELREGQLHRSVETESACRRTNERNAKQAASWNNLGLLLGDYLGHGDQAAAAFRKAIELQPADRLAPTSNLISVLRDQLNEQQAARLLARQLPPTDSKSLQAGILLHPVLFAAYDDNWGVATQHLDQALTLISEHSAFPADTFPAWMRASAVLMHLGFGQKLLSFLRDRGDDQRLRPWYEALRAMQRGDRRYLRNAPAEMQEVAGKLYDEIALRLTHLPPSTGRWAALENKARATPKRKTVR